MTDHKDNPDPTTGLREIDEQHKEWFQRARAFLRAVDAGTEKSVLLRHIEYIELLAEIHFTREEAYMKKFQCPAEAENRAEHARFRLKLAEIKQKVRAGNFSEQDLADWEHGLDRWEKNHIRKIDSQLREIVEVL